MKPRPDLLDEVSAQGLELIQLTTEPAVPSSHVYMEAQIFTPDSKRFVLHRSAHPHGSDKRDPKHQYLLCDIDDGCRLTPLTTEVGATGPSVSPDGRYLYYFVDETEPGRGALSLKRVNTDGTGRQTILKIDHCLPGTKFRPSRAYPLSTISSDGNRLAISAFLGDGTTPAAPWGLLVFDIPSATVNLVLHGPSWCNMHPQYSRSTNPAAAHDLLIQENHGNDCDPNGKCTRLVGGAGADVHVIRDDGTNFRDMPWGRDGNEQCQGHQCWRGRSDWAITSTVTADPKECQLIESRAVEHQEHIGAKSHSGHRNHLSRKFLKPDFYHFATDIEGRYFITDCGPMDRRGCLYFCELGKPGEDSFRRMTYLLTMRSSWDKGAHTHPFLSPDGKIGFFNSDESGILQAYMIRGLRG